MPHHCSFPPLWLEVKVPVAGTLVQGTDFVDMEVGDLWKCERCHQLYVVARACDYCNTTRIVRNHPGVHTYGVTWRPTYSWLDKRRWKRANR